LHRHLRSFPTRRSSDLGLLEIAAYVPGKEHVEGVAKVYKLSSNETPLGPSPQAIEAYRYCAENLSVYPDGQALALRQAIAESQRSEEHTSELQSRENLV